MRRSNVDHATHICNLIAILYSNIEIYYNLHFEIDATNSSFIFSQII